MAVWRRLPGLVALRRLDAAVGRGGAVPAVLRVAVVLAGVAGTRWLVRIGSPIGMRLSRIAGVGRPVRIILHVAWRLAGVVGTRGLVPIISHIGLRLSRIGRCRRHVRIILHIARRLAGVVVGSTRPVGIILVIPLLLPLAI